MKWKTEPNFPEPWLSTISHSQMEQVCACQMCWFWAGAPSPSAPVLSASTQTSPRPGQSEFYALKAAEMISIPHKSNKGEQQWGLLLTLPPHFQCTSGRTIKGGLVSAYSSVLLLSLPTWITVEATCVLADNCPLRTWSRALWPTKPHFTDGRFWVQSGPLALKWLKVKFSFGARLLQHSGIGAAPVQDGAIEYAVWMFWNEKLFNKSSIFVCWQVTVL